VMWRVISLGSSRKRGFGEGGECTIVISLVWV
jgi:hypothetical protein